MVLPLILAGGALYLARRYVNKAEAAAAAADESRSLQVADSGAGASLAISVGTLDPARLERHVVRMLVVAAAALAITLVGSLVAAPLAVVGLVLALYTTGPIWTNAYHSLWREKRVRVSVLDAIAIIFAVLTGYFYAVALGAGLFYFSRRLLLRTENRSQQDLAGVFGSLPRTAWVLIDGAEVRRPLESLRAGDVVVVQAGDTIPVDGRILAGIGSIDQHVLTGEAQPAEREVGDLVYASTLVLAGRLELLVEKAGEETVVAQIGDILRRTADVTSSMQSRGEELADRMAPPFLALAAVALPVVGPVGAGSVLMSSFGYHLRVLSPIGMLNFLSLASRQGILIKDGRSLELLHKVDTVVFDKTGTLTLEQPHVGEVHVYDGRGEDEILRFAAAAERRQLHPIARAILQEAESRGIDVPASDDSRYEIGYGIKVRTDDAVVRVGSARFMEMEEIELPREVRAEESRSEEEGHSMVYVAADGALAGGIELHATIRPEARRVVRSLQRRGVGVAIISGDHERPTRNLARQLGIDDYYAETLPRDKARLIARLQAEGRAVCFVGDGINDAIALKEARVSVSLRGASTAAVDSAQVVLMSENLETLGAAFELSRQFDDNMRLSFAATIVPGAIGVVGAFFFGFGFLEPILLNNTGLALGIANTMLPVWRQRPATADGAGAATTARLSEQPA